MSERYATVSAEVIGVNVAPESHPEAAHANPDDGG
jgi:hypothetical protein